MKKTYCLIPILFLTVCLTSCIAAEETTETINVKDSLKISTWLLDEKLEGTGYWAYDFDDWDDCGYWVSDDGTVTESGDDVFVHEELLLNHPRVSAPLSYNGDNLNFRIESEDVIKVSTTIRNNEDIILVHSPSSPDEPTFKDWSIGNPITVVGSFTLNVFPVGKILPGDMRYKLSQLSTLTDREYYIDINTYTLDGRPRVTAQLRLTVLKDEHFPWREHTNTRAFGTTEEQSRFLEIELVKFGYSDTALHDEFERYDHLYN